MRRLAAVMGGLLLVLLVPAPASAHLIGGGIEPSNYRSRIVAVRPALPAGVAISLVNSGTRLKLSNGGTREAVVLDPDGTPFLRVAPGSTVSWNDQRTHWTGATPPAVRRAPGRAQVVLPRWTVQLRYGGQLVEVSGEVRWVPGPPPLLWLGLAAVLAICVVAVGGAAFWRHALAAVLALVVAIDLLHTAGAWAGVDAPLLASLLASSISLIGWAVALLSIRQLLRGRSESGLFQLLLAVGLIAVVGGLSDLGTLLRSQVATALPESAARAAVAGKIGLGVGAIAAALLRLRVVLRPDETDENEPDEETRHAQLFAR
jgi:hypothetical protein